MCLISGIREWQKLKKSNSLSLALGAAGGGLVLGGFLYHFMSLRGISLEMFLAFEIIGILLIIIGILV